MQEVPEDQSRQGIQSNHPQITNPVIPPNLLLTNGVEETKQSVEESKQS